MEIKISDALLYIVYKNNSISSNELLNYMKLLKQYGMVKISEDGLSCSLTEKGFDRLTKQELT